VITGEFREWRGCSIPLEGKRVQDVAENLHREIIDLELEVAFQRREYDETQLWDTELMTATRFAN
jgi:putative transposase